MLGLVVGCLDLYFLSWPSASCFFGTTPCWWCSGEKVGAGACKRGLSDVPKEQCLSRAKCLKKYGGHDGKSKTAKKYLYSTHVKPTKDKK